MQTVKFNIAVRQIKACKNGLEGLSRRSVQRNMGCGNMAPLSINIDYEARPWSMIAMAICPVF